MSELEKWYRENHLRVEERGLKLALRSPGYVDGECGHYMFRFIDGGSLAPDIEIMNAESGETIQHNLALTDAKQHSIFDAAIDFIAELSGRRKSLH